jgi:tetratricopeptide (TPR) repeat protein
MTAAHAGDVPKDVSIEALPRSVMRTTPQADSAAIAKLYFDQGVDEYNPGRLDSALVMFNLALRWDSLSAPAWQAKGATLARLNRHEEAQTAFDVALRIRPDYLIAWWHRGCDNAVAGRVEEALSDLRHAIAIDSTAKSWPLDDDCWDSLWGDSRLRDVTR